MNEFELFQAALEIEDPTERKTFLESACKEDTALVHRVESLLASHEGESLFLKTPVGEQLSADAVSGTAATVILDEGSTRNTDPAARTRSGIADATAPAALQDDEEIQLGYLAPPTQPDSLGRLAHYEILEILGRGAFGTVLKAFDEKLQRVVAIKVLAPELASTSPARKRFIREAQASAAIRHEHVVSIYDWQEKPIPYLVMEYIPGQTLQQRLDERGPLDVATVLRLGTQIAEGLAAAHARDLIHRDIKPGNILLETTLRDHVKITDFGLARAADDASMTQSGVIAGTPMYMAPEQALGHSLDQRADLFSLGSVLYQMVSGRPPFRASSTLAVLKRLTEEPARPIQEIIPETPDWLCNIIAKLHAKNPDERYQSAREIADVLANCEKQLKDHSGLRDLSMIPQTAAPPPATWWKWVVAAVLLVAMLALAGTELAGVTQLFRGPQVATDPNQPSGDPTPAAAWVPLFNGKDLTGWRGQPEAPGDWRVENGILIGRGPVQSYLYSERSDYQNFHLRAEAKVNANGNAGVHFHALMPRVKLNGAPMGYEVQIAGSRGDVNRTGSLFKFPGDAWLLGKANEQVAPDDHWFTFEIIVQGRHVVTRVNDTTVVDTMDIGPETGRFALQVMENDVVVEFRKIEIKELPPSDSIRSELAKHRFGSDEWIDVIPLIDPALDKWNVPQRTGKNDWRIEQGELVVGGDALASKLVLPLDSNWPAFECELEFTRRAGNSGLNLNLPTKQGECPLLLDPTGNDGAHFGSRAKGVLLKAGAQLVTGQRASLRIAVRPQQDGDQVSVALDGAKIGEWTGDRSAIAYSYQEGFPHDRRLSLWIHPGGNEFVFHRIRVRMLDGGTVETLRPVPAAPPVATAEPAWTPLFNGKDLTGWKTHPDQPGNWKVENGVLVGGGNDLMHLFSERGDYENFHLKAEIKIVGETSGSLDFRSEYGFGFDLKRVGDDSKRFVPIGYELLITPPGGKSTNTSTSNGPVGNFSSLTPEGTEHSAIRPKDDEPKSGDWVLLEVIARGDQITLLGNGKVVLEYLEKTPFRTRGHFVLQSWWGAVLHLRKMEIRELPPTQRAASPAINAKTPPLAVAPFDAKQARDHQQAWATHLNMPVEHPSASGLKFMLIPPGEFTMGSSQEEIDRAVQRNAKLFENPLDVSWHRNSIESEGPAHPVTITRPFYLGATHVTVGQFRRFVTQTKHRVVDDRWEKHGFEQTDDHPAVFVAWSDAAAYCRWLGEQEGRACRLPTEAEWEYACRAGTMTRYWFGDNEADVPKHAWLKPNSEERTHPVGTLAANPFGLYDMLGNAWQWCEDPHDPAFYRKSPQADPFCETGTGRLIRGGSWHHDPLFGRSAFRNSTSMNPAAQADAEKGFRVAFSADRVRPTTPPAPLASTNASTFLKPTEMKSEGGATLKLQEDGSILASGENPNKDTYVLSIAALPAKIRTLRLDALTHASLPNQGPGRNDQFPFVLSAIKAELVPAGNADPPRAWKFAKASSDGSGDDALPDFALDADDNTGWSAESGKPHFAQFELEEPLDIPTGAVLRVTLEFKHDDAQRALGCFRLSSSP